MIPAQHNLDTAGTHGACQLIGPLRVAGHGANAKQVRTSEVVGGRIHRFIDQGNLGAQFRWNQAASSVNVVAAYAALTGVSRQRRPSLILRAFAPRSRIRMLSLRVPYLDRTPMHVE